MTQESRVGSDTQLSTHSSLEEEEIDLDREQQRKMSKVGHHQPMRQNLGFAGAAYATNVAAKQRRGRRKQGYDLATALRISGAVAIAGTAWCPKELSGAKTKENGIFSTAVATTAVAKGKRFRKRDKSKTVATALESAGAVAIAAAAWTPTKKLSKIQQKPNLWDPQKRTMKGAGLAARAMAKANTNYKRVKEYSVAEALRTAGGVAIVGASWTRPLREPSSMAMASPARTVQSIELQSRQVTEHPILVDMATSPIPQYEAEVVPDVSTEPTPSPIVLTPEIVPLVLASGPKDSVTPTRTITPVYTPSIPRNSAITPAIVAEETRTPTPVIVVQPVRTPTPTPVVETIKTPTPSPQPTSQPSTKEPTPEVKTPTPSPHVTAPIPNPVVTHTTVHTVIKEERRPRSSRSRSRSPGGVALLLAANARNRRSPSPKAAAPAVVETQKAPTPNVPTPLPDVVHKEETTPVVELQPPTPAEVSAKDIEEIVLPEEQALTVAGAAAGTTAAAPKPKRKPLAKLTPLERLTAKARSLQ